MRKFLLLVRSYLGTLAEADQLRQATIPIQAQQGWTCILKHHRQQE